MSNLNTTIRQDKLLFKQIRLGYEDQSNDLVAVTAVVYRRLTAWLLLLVLGVDRLVVVGNIGLLIPSSYLHVVSSVVEQGIPQSPPEVAPHHQHSHRQQKAHPRSHPHRDEYPPARLPVLILGNAVGPSALRTGVNVAAEGRRVLLAFVVVAAVLPLAAPIFGASGQNRGGSEGQDQNDAGYGTSEEKSEEEGLFHHLVGCLGHMMWHLVHPQILQNYYTQHQSEFGSQIRVLMYDSFKEKGRSDKLHRCWLHNACQKDALRTSFYNLNKFCI